MKKLFYLTFLLFVGTVSCNLLDGGKKQNTNEEKTIESRNTVLENVLENKELRVVVDYNSTNYFIYRGQPMGFQYELLRQFAKHLNVDLKINVSNNLEETFAGLNNSDYDLIAKNLTVTTARNKIVDFTEPLALTRQVLVQRKFDNPENAGGAGTENKLIREQLDLAGKTIYVQKNTVFVQRLKHLSEEIGEPIEIVEDTIYGVEQLVALVASGEIDYTVCDENVGLVNQKYYPWIDVETPISFNQKLSWAVQKNNDDWKEYIDSWIVEFKKTSTYNVIYNKYFSGNRNTNIVRSDYHSINGGKISDYDDIVRDIALHNNWDWRLVASIIMQESNFDTYAESWMGALGLMQLMPLTASQYDVEEFFDPRENIRGGVEHLNWLRKVFNPIIEDEDERLKFILASYNVGIGHVMDARKLAMKYGLDPSVWKDNVDIFILKKSIPQFYNDPVVKWGYCRGEEPYNYVIKILDRYHQYVNILPDENNIALVSLPVLQSSLR